MRWGSGAFWPRSRGVVFLVDFAWRDREPGFCEGDLVESAPWAFAADVVTPIPAATSSVRARWVALRTRINFCRCAAGDESVSPGLLLLVLRRNDAGEE